MKIISGGQTGADQAGWRAAKAAGLETGGWMPCRFMTEDGPRPEFEKLYGARVWTSGSDGTGESYRDRTYRNAAEADITLWFHDDVSTDSPGYWCTRKGCLLAKTAFLVVETTSAPWRIANAIMGINTCYLVVNIAGSRESRSPGIGTWVEEFLGRVFAEIGL
jgi:hypothetical protein